MMNKFSRLLQSFLTDYIISERNYSINTKISYSTTFYLLVNFINDKYNIKPNEINVETLNKDIIIEFLNWLEQIRKNSIQTRNQRLAIIKSFYNYVQLREPELFHTCSEILSIKNKKSSQKIISYFSEEEIKIIIKFLNKKKDYKKLMLICVLYETGARVTELINIKIKDLNLNDISSIRLEGKGNKVRVVPISSELVNLINKYIKHNNISNDNCYLFYSNQNKKYNRKSINYIINTVIKDLKKEYPTKFKGTYSPHSFRHSKATHLYNNGTPLLYIKDFLGHSHVSTTEIYATPDSNKQRKDIIKNAEKLNVNLQYTNNEKQTLDNWLKNNMKS